MSSNRDDDTRRDRSASLDAQAHWQQQQQQAGGQYFLDHGGAVEETPPLDDNSPSPNISAVSPSSAVGKDDLISSTTHIALKMLVSNNVAGSIIGRAGQAIAELQNQSKCRVKLSQAHDCFPGTSDRVCLLQGDVSSILYAIRLILVKFRHQTAPQQQAQQADPNHSNLDPTPTPPPDVEAIITCRILVPSAACGMLIGRGGCHIKSLAEKSHARIQLAQKEEMASVATSERVVTMTGNMRSCMSCVTMVLEGVVQNPDLYKYSNMTTSYTKAVAASAFSQAAVAAAAAAAAAMASHQSGSGSGNVISRSTDTHQGTGGGTYTHHISKSYGEDSTLLAVQQSPVISSTVPDFHSEQFLIDFAAADQSSSPSLHTQPQDNTSTPDQPVSSTSTSVSDQQQKNKDGITTLQIFVPDSLVGGILGRGGAGIAEIQICSGTRIKVSERGDFVPGTTNRLVAITGSGQACATAHFLISQRMAQQVISPNNQGSKGVTALTAGQMAQKRRRGRRGKGTGGTPVGKDNEGRNGNGGQDSVDDVQDLE